MKTFKSPLYGDIPKPASFNELVKLFLIDGKRNGSNHLKLPVKYWRGQSDIKWRLDSSGYRRVEPAKNDSGGIASTLSFYESYLLKEATHQGYRFHNGRNLSDMELLARLQHHGSATRLMDFSANVLIALWFCSSENIDENGLLIGIHSHHLGGAEKMIESRNYETVIKSCEKTSHPMLLDSPNNSARIPAQHSAFLYSRISTHKAGSLEIDYDFDGHSFICISPSLKADSIEILETLYNIRLESLFPDIDGFGRANDQSRHWSAVSRW